MDAPEDVPADDLAKLAPTWFRRRRRARLRRAIAALTGSVAVYGLAALLLIPPVIFLGAGVWSVIAYARTLFSLWDLLKNWHFHAFLAGLSGSDLAVRTAIASGAYFALLFALIVIFSGLLGRRWQRLLILPGLLLGVPALLVFLAGMQEATEALAAALPLPDLVASLATIYALADLALLAAFLTDLRPRLPRHRRHRASAQASVVLPLVRFGPPVPTVTEADQLPYDETPSDPRMTVSVTRALNDSVPVAILPVITASQREEVPARNVAEMGES